MTFLWVPVGIFVLLVAIGIVRRLRLIHGQLAAYRLGDYAGQMRLVEGFKHKGVESAEYLFFHGAACFELGRLAEAEGALRRSLALETNPALRTVCRDQLAHALIELERYPEAYDRLEECIQEMPNRGGAHRALAELLLRRGGDDAGALESAQRAVTLDRAKDPGRSKLGREERDTNLGESLAFLAWALARNRAEPAGVEAALKEALDLCGEGAKPIATEIHFCAGNVYELLDNPGESHRHFRRAVEIDPAGNYGRLSQRELKRFESQNA